MTVERSPEHERWLDERLPGVTASVRELVALAVIDGPFGLNEVTTWSVRLHAHPACGERVEIVIWLKNTRGGKRGFGSVERWTCTVDDRGPAAKDARRMIEAEPA